jgi:hypothetical protein
MMFRDSIDAFLYLLDGREQRDHPARRHSVSSIQVDMKLMANGIKRCGIQVMFDDGAGYSIEAYDREADELYKEAKMQARLSETLLTTIA